MNHAPPLRLMPDGAKLLAETELLRLSNELSEAYASKEKYVTDEALQVISAHCLGSRSVQEISLPKRSSLRGAETPARSEPQNLRPGTRRRIVGEEGEIRQGCKISGWADGTEFRPPLKRVI